MHAIAQACVDQAKAGEPPVAGAQISLRGGVVPEVLDTLDLPISRVIINDKVCLRHSLSACSPCALRAACCSQLPHDCALLCCCAIGQPHFRLM